MSNLDEPVSGIGGPVEVTLRPIGELAAGSPAAVLHAMCALPRLEPGDVDELERMIEGVPLWRRGAVFLDT